MKEAWEKEHQPFELGYHREYGVSWCFNEKQFQDWWDEIRDWIKPSGDILDIGCGPRPPFKGTIIEPLAIEYKKITPQEWWYGVSVFAEPAEEHLEILDDMFDFVVCWNCLDHTYDYKSILDNVVQYLRDDGTFILATDLKEPNKYLGHPSFPKDELMKEINKRFTIVETLRNFKERELCLKLRKHGK